MKVYAISNGTQVKVGRSGAPRGRLGSLQTASPTALHLCCEADCGSSLMAAAVERFAHELLADRRAAGEWFDVSPSQAEAAIDAAIKMIEQGRERETKTVPFSMRLDPDLKEGLQKLADADRRNLTNFIEVKLREIISDQTPVKSVYVTASQSRTKIGITSRCCAKRAAEISRSIGSPVVLVYSLESARARLIEIASHYMLRQYRQRGEWFNVTSDVAKSVVRRAAKRIRAGDFSITGAAWALRSELQRRRYTDQKPSESELIQGGLEGTVRRAR